MPLGPGTPNTAILRLLTAFDPLVDLGPIRNHQAARACLSALWLYHDFLNESHTISQNLLSATGSFLHAVMHRREPDPDNSKYWWRRVGSHPVVKELVSRDLESGIEYRSPLAFVDLCEDVRDTGSALEDAARRVQLLEWQLIFDYCHRCAVGVDEVFI
jgi:hypothetical protein